MKKFLLVIGLFLTIGSVSISAGSAYIPYWEDGIAGRAQMNIFVSNVTNSPIDVAVVLYDSTGAIAHTFTATITGGNTERFQVLSGSSRRGWGVVRTTNTDVNYGALLAYAYWEDSVANGIYTRAISINGGELF